MDFPGDRDGPLLRAEPPSGHPGAWVEPQAHPTHRPPGTHGPTQWAAVSTHWGWIREPPQWCLQYWWLTLRLTCQGHLLPGASCPPTMPARCRAWPGAGAGSLQPWAPLNPPPAPGLVGVGEGRNPTAWGQDSPGAAETRLSRRASARRWSIWKEQGGVLGCESAGVGCGVWGVGSGGIWPLIRGSVPAGVLGPQCSASQLHSDTWCQGPAGGLTLAGPGCSCPACSLCPFILTDNDRVRGGGGSSNPGEWGRKWMTQTRASPSGQEGALPPPFTPADPIPPCGPMSISGCYLRT